MEPGVVHTSMNIFDLGVIAVLGLSALLSFFRGFIREVLSLGAWVGATIITLYLFQHVAENLGPHVKDRGVAGALAALGIFMVALIIISIFNSILLRYVKTGSEVGLLDNGLGLVFGMLRGALLVALAYFIMTITMAPRDYPPAIRTAKSQPYVEQAAATLAQFAPKYLRELSPLKDKDAGKTDTLNKILENGNDSEDAEPSPHWSSMNELPETHGRRRPLMFDKFHEECGVFGIWGHPDAAAMTALGPARAAASRAGGGRHRLHRAGAVLRPPRARPRRRQFQLRRGHQPAERRRRHRPQPLFHRRRHAAAQRPALLPPTCRSAASRSRITATSPTR